MDTRDAQRNRKDMAEAVKEARGELDALRGIIVDDILDALERPLDEWDDHMESDVVELIDFADEHED